jgi:hypothetical protein
MPTVIDELVVKLGLDPKDFVSGQKKAEDALRKTKDAAKEGSKEVSEGASDMLKAFGGLQGKLLGVAALFTGGLGLTEFSKKMAAVTTQTTYLSRQIGVSAQELEALDAAGAKVGANAGEISGSIAGVYRQLKSGELHGVSRLQSYFQSMTSRKYPTGIPLTNPDGSDRSPTDLFADVARWGSGQHDKAMVSQLWSEMGLAPGAINLLLQGPDVFRAQVEKGKQAALSDADRKKFEGLNSSFHQLAVDADRLGRAIALDLLPGVKQFIEFIDEIVKKIKPSSPEQVQKFTDKHLPEMVGGPKSIFGRIKNWWNGSSASDNAGSSPPASSSAASQPSAYQGPFGGTPHGGTRSGWWTPERKSYAMNYLMKNAGLPETGARALVARWADVEATGGPSEVNSIGATGIAQWLGGRKNGVVRGDFEGQLAHAVRELKSTEGRAYRALLGAKDDRSAAIGAAMFERAEGYNARTGEDLFVDKTVRGMRGMPRIPPSDVFATGADGIFPHPGLMALQGAGNVAHNNTTSSTSINNLIVNTPTNDPNAHAADVRAALERNEAMNQANQGPN